ncbi:MAG TPA: CoA ester lyase [Acholeplasmataceae bacterium]|nr:CoA ester lyase [Acholeplasmataceae bacterium]HBO68232.1 CoA ester lyase [Acholeplasmataceae bacterium]HBS00532.1 CoA ester lyase [Acholeplasmataceae bacterium]HCB20108.1 CoA ester lyase [Acholeplasmataceae bacterium]
MRRSLLFIPANSPAMLQNADIFDTDGLIFDLEDAISLMEKDAARDLLSAYFETYQLEGVELIIRMNQLDSIYADEDLKRALSWPIDSIMVPKARYQDLVQLEEKLEKLEKKLKRDKKLMLIPIIEQAIALFEVNQIASLSRVSALLLGGEDLATNLEVERTKDAEEILLARQLVIYAAKAYGKDAIDTPFTDVSDKEGLIADAKHAKRLGMSGKSCIHPIQIDDINTIFSPTEKEIVYAKRVIEAEKEALLNHKGVFSVDGKMVDKPIIDRAKKLLEKVKS